MDVEIVLDQNDGPGVREVDIYSTCSSERLLSACKTSIRNITIASSGFLPALLFLISSGVSTTALCRHESSPRAPVDRLLRADRPSQTVPPTACPHRTTRTAPSSPPRITPSRMRFAQLASRGYFSRCPLAR